MKNKVKTVTSRIVCRMLIHNVRILPVSTHYKSTVSKSIFERAECLFMKYQIQDRNAHKKALQSFAFLIMIFF